MATIEQTDPPRTAISPFVYIAVGATVVLLIVAAVVAVVS
jgi:hypothetical protein